MQRIALATLVCLSLFSACQPAARASDGPVKVEAALQSLRKTSGEDLAIAWNPETGTPSFVGGKLTRPSNHTPIWIAHSFLNRYRALFGIRDTNRELQVTGVEPYSEGVKVHLRHLLFRTPIWEDGLTVDLDRNGVVRSVAGTIHPDMEKKLRYRAAHPAYSEQQAVRKAVESASGEIAMDNPAAERYYLASRAGTPLVYVVSVRLRNPERTETIVVHSATGRVIERR